MDTYGKKKRTVLFSFLLLLSACGGGGGDQDQEKCDTQLLSQLCGYSWVSDCLDQATHYIRATREFGNDKTFSFDSRNYSDPACTAEISALAYSGTILEGGDIPLIDGSTGREMDLSITFYDGSDIAPSVMQYTIMKLDTSNANIMYMGDTHDTNIERDGDNRVRLSIPYRKQ